VAGGAVLACPRLSIATLCAITVVTERSMTYTDQWKAISSRILGLMRAGTLHAQFLAVRSSDTYSRAKRLREHCVAVISAIRQFREQFRQTLPPDSLVSIDEFVQKADELTREKNGSPDAFQERVWAALVALTAFETEISFILSNPQESIRARSERAFAHLQRLIVVDSTFRERWKGAFEDGEVACEKLGAVHLLLHGIWAFKVDASGARTDLVFQEPAGSLANEQRYVDGFVLTEWKKSDLGDDPTVRFQQARSQAHRYAQGALAGTELTAYRYAVVVSRQQVSIPEDLREGEVVYRHINIAVDPLSPSRR